MALVNKILLAEWTISWRDWASQTVKLEVNQSGVCRILTDWDDYVGCAGYLSGTVTVKELGKLLGVLAGPPTDVPQSRLQKEPQLVWDCDVKVLSGISVPNLLSSHYNKKILEEKTKKVSFRIPALEYRDEMIQAVSEVIQMMASRLWVHPPLKRRSQSTMDSNHKEVSGE